MTNIIAAIIITTNSHWSVLTVEPSSLTCAVLGCDRDHSEKRTEQQTLYRVIQARFEYGGKTNLVTLESEEIPCPQKKTRVLYSGFDYERDRLRTIFHRETKTNFFPLR